MLIDKPLGVNEILEDENERTKIGLILNNINGLLKDNINGSVSIAISGDWGSGKTTYLKVIESYYRYSLKRPVLFFEAWKYQDEDNPLVPLILELQRLPNIKKTLKTKLQEILKPLLVSGISICELISGIKLETIEKAFELVEKEQLTLISKYRQSMELLKKTIEEIRNSYRLKDSVDKDLWQNTGDTIHPPGKGCFVLIIDDLDRLIPEKAFKVIEALRFYFDIDNVLIVMGINDRILNDYVRRYYWAKEAKEELDEEKSEKFLEKIFHWNYEITYSDINSLHLRSLKKVLNEQDIEKIRAILSNIDLLSHRKWIKLMNRIEKDISTGKDEYPIERIVFASAIKELYPKLELFSRRFPEVIDMLYTGQTGGNVVNKAIEIIKRDTSYLDFPEKNYKSLYENTRVVVKV